jgi:hypothetical protein
MNRFDRILWRINGVLFLALLAAGLWGFLTTLTAFYRDRNIKPREAVTVVDQQGNRSGEKETLSLDDLKRVSGTPFVRMPLRKKRESDAVSSFGSYKGRRPDTLINYLYLNTADLSSWWLFEGFDRAITDQQDLRTETGGNDRAVVATLFEVVVKDTNGDHLLTSADQEAVYFCGADGRRPIEIIPPSDGVLGVEQVSPGQFMIIYRREQSVTASLFSLANGAKLKETVLPVKEHD